MKKEINELEKINELVKLSQIEAETEKRVREEDLAVIEKYLIQVSDRNSIASACRAVAKAIQFRIKAIAIQSQSADYWMDKHGAAREEGHDEGFDHGYDAGYAEGLNLRKEYNDQARIKEIEEKARQEGRKQQALENNVEIKCIYENGWRQALEELRIKIATGGGWYYNETARQEVMALSVIIELIERLQEREKQ